MQLLRRNRGDWGPVVIDIAHPDVHGAPRYTKTVVLTALLSALRWICMRPPDSAATYNIFTDSDHTQNHFVYPTKRSPSAKSVLISSARTLLDEGCGSILVAIIVRTKAHTKLLSNVAEGTSVQISWRYSGDRSPLCLSLCLCHRCLGVVVNGSIDSYWFIPPPLLPAPNVLYACLH